MTEVEIKGKRDIYTVKVTKNKYKNGFISEVYNSSGKLVWTQINNTSERDITLMAQDAVEFYEEVEEEE